MTDEVDPTEFCPVCLNPWGDIRHVVVWHLEHLEGPATITCNWNALKKESA